MLPIPFRHPRRARSRGQSLVEFALVLPVLLLLLLAALDFGRVFLGWVVLNNAARVGANYAALHPNAWGSPGIPAQQTSYEDQVRDARADASISFSGCDTEPIAPPTFPGGTDVGDYAVVSLTCDFSPLTPIIGEIFRAGGNKVAVTAESVFAIRTGAIAGPPMTPPPACPALAAFTFEIDSSDPLRVHFTDTSTGSPSGWIWDFDDGFGSAVQNPSHTYASGGSYTVVLSVNGCSSYFLLVTVTEPAPSTSPDPSASPTPTPTASPTPAPCVVPSFIATKKNDAQATWQSAGFTTTVAFSPDPNGNWTIEAQSLVGGQIAPCNAQITLGPDPLPNP